NRHRTLSANLPPPRRWVAQKIAAHRIHRADDHYWIWCVLDRNNFLQVTCMHQQGGRVCISINEGSTTMSGHSKWAQIRRSKGVNDARRGQLFTRLGRELVVAVREGGSGDPNANFRLRMAVQRARDANMPMDNIERTIKRAVSGSEGSNLEEITYEGYGPGGTAIVVQTLTDNRNRTVAEVRNGFHRNRGNIRDNCC